MDQQLLDRINIGLPRIPAGRVPEALRVEPRLNVVGTQTAGDVNHKRIRE